MRKLRGKTKMMIILVVLGLLGAQKVLSLEITNRNYRDQYLEIFSGLRFDLDEEELRLKLDLEKIFPVTEVQSRTDRHGHDEKQPESGLQKFGSFLVMLPLLMQMLSLPGAIASIKMSLLKSVVVAKLAFFVMLFNFLRSQQAAEIVVVRQPPPQHYDHFYHHTYPHEEYEDNDKGWFG